MNIEKFQTKIWNYYKKHGRHTLPWRKTTHPYRILLSEMMLQQTQVSRVIPKYKSFLKTFPTLKALAEAPRSQVLIAWQGLGYNRRAKFLHETAQAVLQNKHGKLPRTYSELIELPGIGDYTARAICVFAFKQALPMIETNIRTVFIHHFFKKHTHVSDAELVRVAEKVLDTAHPREWNWALMDYGTYLKENSITAHRQSAQYAKQTTFKGSNREVRGVILRILSNGNPCTLGAFKQETGFSKKRLREQTTALCNEGFIVSVGKETWSLSSI
jgi:A/G-specific adenine glycosylase